MSMNIIEDQCPSCYRTFNPDVLQRHIPICNKVSNKVRKPLDAQKQRIAGTEITSVPKTQTKVVPPKKSSWKEKHEEFVQNIQYARQAKAAEIRGEQVAPPPPSKKPSDHVDCPTCGRSFNPSSADRHLKFCAEQAKKGKPGDVKGKAEAASRRDKMKGFKSTFDKKKEQQAAVAGRKSEYNPSNYGGGGGGAGGGPHSRTLRATENRSAPTPHRTGAPRYMEQAEEEPARPPRPGNNRKIKMNGEVPARRVSSARGTNGSHIPPFCYECGAKYPVKSAKFCCECGTERLRND